MPSTAYHVRAFCGLAQGTPRAGGAKAAGGKRRALLDLLDQVAVSTATSSATSSATPTTASAAMHHSDVSDAAEQVDTQSCWISSNCMRHRAHIR